ncbi:hypothetical protein [Nocardia pseudovaccinii]|uniref:hypothetical protein n=1 Tax=Nocardia pseudovaccinii TaxID=189540 RepID=UPI0007A424D7|nr:hypothetical protein [Nocardia pseudovaccinii]
MTTSPTDSTSVGQWIARLIAIVLLIPLRLVWEGVKLLGRITAAALTYIWNHLLDPICHLAWHWLLRPAWAFVKDFLWGWLLHYVLWGLVLTPLATFALDYFLRPLRRAVEVFLWRRILRPALTWLTKNILLPIAAITLRVLYLGCKYLIAWPAYQLWRWILHPLWRLLRTALICGWLGATAIVGVLVVTPCRAIYRIILRPILISLATAWRITVVRPTRWTYLNVVQPMNKWATQIMTTVFGN